MGERRGEIYNRAARKTTNQGGPRLHEDPSRAVTLGRVDKTIWNKDVGYHPRRLPITIIIVPPWPRPRSTFKVYCPVLSRTSWPCLCYSRHGCLMWSVVLVCSDARGATRKVPNFVPRDRRVGGEGGGGATRRRRVAQDATFPLSALPTCGIHVHSCCDGREWALCKIVCGRERTDTEDRILLAAPLRATRQAPQAFLHLNMGQALHVHTHSYVGWSLCTSIFLLFLLSFSLCALSLVGFSSRSEKRAGRI